MYQYLLLLDTEQEREFFQKMYHEHKNAMYYIALRILKNESDAEDMVHETFLALTKYLSRMIDNQPQKNWNFILTILKHKCYNLCKKKKQEIDKCLELENTTDTYGEKPDDRMERLEKQELMIKLIREMKPSYQEVLILKYYHELNNTEIAAVLGETQDNIRHIYMRAKHKMEKMLENYGILDAHGI